MKSIVATAAVIACCLALSPALADEIVVFSTPSLQPVLTQLGPKFEEVTGHRLKIRHAAVGTLKREIDLGASFDAALLLPAQIDELIKEGKIVGISRTDLAVAVVGVAVRQGMPQPDIGSVDAFRNFLLSVNSVAYGAESASGKYFLGLIDRLNIGQKMQSKLRMISGNPVEAVARGEADLTVITVPNIVSVPGVEFVGVLPSPLQNVTTYTAAVSAAAEKPVAADALLLYLKSENAAAVFAANGLMRPGT